MKQDVLLKQRFTVNRSLKQNVTRLTMLEYSHCGEQNDWMAIRPAGEMLPSFLGMPRKEGNNHISELKNSKDKTDKYEPLQNTIKWWIIFMTSHVFLYKKQNLRPLRRNRLEALIYTLNSSKIDICIK